MKMIMIIRKEKEYTNILELTRLPGIIVLPLVMVMLYQGRAVPPLADKMLYPVKILSVSAERILSEMKAIREIQMY